MGAIASQITSLTIVYSTVYSDADQRKHQSSVSLAFVRGIHWWPVNSPHKWPVTRKMFPFDDVIMCWCIQTAFSTDYIFVLVYWFSSFSSFWWYFNWVKQVKFAVSRHFLEIAWKQLAEICHADVSWPSWELIWFLSRSVKFPIFFFMFVFGFCANPIGLQQLRGAWLKIPRSTC